MKTRKFAGTRPGRSTFAAAACLTAAIALSVSAASGCKTKKDDDDNANPLTISNAQAVPASVVQGSNVLFSASVHSSAGAVLQVSADLTSAGGSGSQLLYDNGTNGDVTPGDGIFSYLHAVPVATTPGSASIPVSASDAASNSASASISVTIIQNQPPAASNGQISRNPVPPGGRVVFTVAVSDGDGSIASVTADLTSVGGLAAAAMFDDGTSGDSSAGDGTYSLEFIVTPATPTGAKNVTFTATDNATATAQTGVSFSVSGNIAPLMVNAMVNPPTQVQRLSVLFTVGATDADGINSVTINISSIMGAAAQQMYDNGTNGDATPGDNTYSYRYTLPQNCPAGTWNLIMTATDGAASTNWASVTLVTETNDPPHFLIPQAVPNPSSRNQNVLLSVYAADSDGTVASVRINLAPIGGSATATMYDDGTNGDYAGGDWIFTLRYTIPLGTAASNYSLTITGTDDDGVSATTTLNMSTNASIAPTLNTPVANPNPQEVGANVLLSVYSTDDGSVASVTADLSLLGGSSTQTMYDNGTNGDPVGGDSTYTYRYLIPGATVVGNYKIKVTATDNTAITNTIEILLTVQPNTSPVLSNATLNPSFVLPAQNILLTVNVSDMQGMSSITVNLAAIGRSASQTLYDDGTNGDVTSGDGIFSYAFKVPANNGPGPASFGITAQDTLGLTAMTSVSLNVATIKLEHAGFLEDIHGTSASDVYTVGNSNQIYHFNGTVWRMINPGVSGDWEGVWCESAASVWVGGPSGNVIHFDGTDWTSRSIPGAGSYTIRAFWSDGTGKVYAVGGLPGANDGAVGPGAGPNGTDDGHILAVWANGAWSTLLGPTVNDDDLNDIFGSGPNDIVAVGDDGRIFHFNGSSWLSETIPASAQDFFGVWGYTDTVTSFYWAVSGLNSGTANAAIYYYNGATWASVSGVLPDTVLNLRGVHGVTAGVPPTLSAVYATGTYASSRTYGAVWQSQNGQNFSQITNASPPPGYSPNFFPYAPTRLILSDVWIPPGGAANLWVTGHRSIQEYVPGATPPWREYSRGTYENTRAVDVYSISRAITWDYPGRPGTSPTARQYSSIVHYYLAGMWYEYTDLSGTIGPELLTYTMLDPPSVLQGPITPRMYAVRIFSNNDCYGVGDDGHVFHWDCANQIGHDFTSMTQYGTGIGDQRRLYALWGTSAGDFWFGGESNMVYHYIGLGWTSPPPGTPLSGSPNFITSIWGTSNSNVYAVAAQTGVGTRAASVGNVYRYNGSAWTSIAGASGLPAAETAALGNLNSVWGSSSNDVYIVGDGGRAWRWDGSTWTSLAAALGNPTVDLNCVFGDPATGDKFIIGDDMYVWCWFNSAWRQIRCNGSGLDLYGGDQVSTFILMVGQSGITLKFEK